jgi:hypothetical protein
MQEKGTPKSGFPTEPGWCGEACSTGGRWWALLSFPQQAVLHSLPPFAGRSLRPFVLAPSSTRSSCKEGSPLPPLTALLSLCQPSSKPRGRPLSAPRWRQWGRSLSDPRGGAGGGHRGHTMGEEHEHEHGLGAARQRGGMAEHDEAPRGILIQAPLSSSPTNQQLQSS